VAYQVLSDFSKYVKLQDRSIYSEGCPIGKYFSNETSRCESCPLASYNDQTGATYCASCSIGWFTNGDGKTSSTDCLGKELSIPLEQFQMKTISKIERTSI
jgi:ribosomal protein L37E